MGCGCGGGRGRTSRRATLKPVSSTAPRSIQRGLAAGPSPAELRALGMQKATQTPKRMDEKRRVTEKLRRAAIRKRLGK